MSRSQSAKIVGLAVLEKPRIVSNSTRNMIFDAHFWLADGMEIIACLRYFNKTNIEFDEITPAVVDASIVKMTLDAKVEGIELTEDERKDYQVIGDITWLIPVDVEDMRIPPHMYVAAMAVNSQREIATFDMDCAQWTTAFRHIPDKGQLPVRIIIPQNHRFPDPKKLCPSNETYMFVTGRLSKFTLDPSGYLERLHIEAGDFTFMGKRAIPFTPVKTPVQTPVDTGSASKRKFRYDDSPLPRKIRKTSDKENKQPEEGSFSSVTTEGSILST